MKYAVSVALLLLLTACGGAGSEAGGGSPSGTPKPDAHASASAATPAGDPTEGGAGDPADAKAFCAFLTEEQPKLKEVGSGVGAQAALVIDLAAWVTDHPDQQLPTAADYDAAAQRDCPEVRASVIAVTGHSTLEEALR